MQIDIRVVTIAEARRFASLGSIEQDLVGVLQYVDRLEAMAAAWPRINLLEWEALSAATVVRYARCFSSGAREPISALTLLEGAPTRLVEAHDHFIAVRNKHVAHSVSPYEENYVVLQIPQGCTSSAQLTDVNVQHGRILGLESEEEPQLLRELTLWLRARVAEARLEEQRQLLKHLQQLPLSEILGYESTLRSAATQAGAAKRVRRSP